MWGTMSRLNNSDATALFRCIAAVTEDPSAMAYVDANRLVALQEAKRLWMEAAAQGGPSRRAPELTGERIRELMAEGRTQQMIAQTYGVSPMVVSRRKRE